jgi:hypothetical protein
LHIVEDIVEPVLEASKLRDLRTRTRTSYTSIVIGASWLRVLTPCASHLPSLRDCLCFFCFGCMPCYGRKRFVEISEFLEKFPNFLCSP